jgi:hypothetical protein
MKLTATLENGLAADNLIALRNGKPTPATA